LTILPLSELGLMQLSRQRLRISVLEKKTGSCTHCRGTGVLQDLSALSLSLLRELFSRIEDKKKCIFSITASPGLILYVLNHYKQNIHHFETVSSCAVRFLMHTSDQYTLDSSLFTIEETAPEGEKNSSTPVSWEGQYHYDNAPI
jgi:ribonuclease E